MKEIRPFRIAAAGSCIGIRRLVPMSRLCHPKRLPASLLAPVEELLRERQKNQGQWGHVCSEGKQFSGPIWQNWLACYHTILGLRILKYPYVEGILCGGDRTKTGES